MPEAGMLFVQCDAAVGPLRIAVRFSLTKPWTVLFGPSGSGKSSILRLIAGLWTPAGSEVRLGAEDLTRTPPHRRNAGLVSQQPALFPHLDVAGNVGFAGPAARARLDEMLRLFDLGPLRHARIAQLSGGERQRVALARSLAAAPRLLLLDEVFTGMHRAQRDELLGRVQSHCALAGVPVLSVTHDVAETLASADEVLRLEDGRVVAQGSADAVLDDERRQFMESLNQPPAVRT